MKYNSPYQGINSNNAIYLATNENPYELPKDIQQELSRTLSLVNRYPKVENGELKEKIASVHKIKPENIVIGAGSDELLMLIVMNYVGNSDNTIMANPSFFRYKQLTEFAGGDCRLVNCKDFYHDLDAMKKEIDEKTKIIFICNPNNPTGTMLSTDEIEVFVKNIPSHVVVVIDEAYFDYVYPRDSKSGIELINQFPNIIVLRSFSKFFALAGLRIGYAVGSEKVIKKINGIRSPYNVNSIAQSAAIMMMDNDIFNENIYSEMQNEKQFIYNAFDQVGVKYFPSQANFIFVEFGDRCEEWCAKLKEHNIVIRPCGMFGYPNYARITIGTPQENKVVVDVLIKMISLAELENT